MKQNRLSDLATALSHVKLWSQFVAEATNGHSRLASDSLLVLEDDASLPDTFCWADITRRLSAAPAGWSMISLFEFDPYKNRGKKKRTPKKWDSTLLKVCPETTGTAEAHATTIASAATLRVRHHALGMVGYVISREGATRLLKLVLPLKDKAIDQVRMCGAHALMSQYCADFRLKCLVYPGVDRYREKGPVETGEHFCHPPAVGAS